VSTSPIEIVGEWLQNLLDPEVVKKVVAPDATYVSLNTEDSELKRILPWAGTSHGPDAFIWNLSEMFRYWQNENFEVTTMFGEGEDVAVFGTFTYRSNTLGKVVTSPFSIHVKVVDGKVTYLQFLEDTYATAASFRSAGSWTVHADPTGVPSEV
jgi:ketosteroid isomerase-like protein